MNTIVHHITIAPDTAIINIISGLKVSKYNKKQETVILELKC